MFRNSRRRMGSRGQSLLETALALPLLLCLAFNAINFGYFWFVILNMSSAARQGVQYSTQGGLEIPASSDVCTLTGTNLAKSFHVASSDYKVQVCSSADGVNTTTHKANCTTTCGGLSATSATPDTDPYTAYFVLHRVDVWYKVTPLIPGTVFNGYKVLLPPNMTFHRQVSMRSLY